MGSSQINKIKDTLGIGARNNKYRIILNAKGENAAPNEKVNTLVKSVTMPGRSFADIEVWVQGRKITQAGDSLYDGTIKINFLDDEIHSLRTSFISWMEYIDSLKEHKREANSVSDYMTDIEIQQLSTIDNTIQKKYTVFNAYPKSISDLSYNEEVGGLIEFSIEMNFSHWV